MPRSARRSSEPRRVAMVVFPDFQILDATGPLEVFDLASQALAERDGSDPAYAISLLAARPGPVRASSGLQLVADGAWRGLRGALDTLIVAGGTGTRAALEDAALIRWLARAPSRARRVAGVCTGSFLLARAGLLDGRRATTHWANADALARSFPRVRVEPDRIYVRDGAISTSAGVTAGMDLALALVEEDHGRDLALAVARRLVLFLKRPGGQSQFSTQLSHQLADRAPLRELQTWIAGHPGEDLGVAALARRVGMSPRHFARVFREQTGVTPARYVESARVEVARRTLEESHDGIEAIASRCGFGSAETLRRAFLRHLKVTPQDYRARFRDGDESRARLEAIA